MEKDNLSYLLACLVCSFFIFLSFNAQAQTTIRNPEQFVQELRQNILTEETAINIIQRETGFDVNQARDFINNLQQIADIESAGKLVENLIRGEIDELLALELSEFINLGELESLFDIENLLNQLSNELNFDELLENFNLGELEDFVGTVLDITGGPEALQTALTEYASQEIAELLENAAPELVEALGGTEAVANAINEAVGGTGITLSTGGGSFPGDDSLHRCCQCQRPIQVNHQRIRSHVTNEFNAYRIWFVSDMFKANILPAWQLMATQMTSAAMQQVAIVGKFFDAKHQLHVQKTFQALTAQAHKDYHPSENLCEFGTNIRSLAASERKSDLVNAALSQRGIARQLSQSDVISKEGLKSDKESRIKHFIQNYCDPTDNGNAFDRFCLGTTSTPERRNKDVNYTQTIETELTLDIDFTDGTITPDEEDIFAFKHNLFANDILPTIAARLLADGRNQPKDLATLYLALRSIVAKRSVAENSINSIISLKANGDNGSAAYLYRLMADLGVNEDELEDLLGSDPSYFAQMEVVSKSIYQTPDFYTNLFDKPVNVERKGAALQAVGLMQDRDTFDSLIRSEASLATLLEVLLQKEHRRVANLLNDLEGDGETQ